LLWWVFWLFLLSMSYALFHDVLETKTLNILEKCICLAFGLFLGILTVWLNSYRVTKVEDFEERIEKKKREV